MLTASAPTYDGVRTANHLFSTLLADLRMSSSQDSVQSWADLPESREAWDTLYDRTGEGA